MPQTTERDSLEFSVTYRNTVKHWVLYSLDSIEAEGHAGDDSSENPARRDGVYPERIYEYAGGEDSIVFRSKGEIQSALSAMARDGAAWEEQSRPVNRRTETTTWDSADVNYRYRLNDWGRDVLLDLGVPSQLPNRRDFDDDDRLLGVKPTHEPGWWQQADRDSWELFDDEWDARDHDWFETGHDRVFIKEQADKAFVEDRDYLRIGYTLAHRFEDVTFVLTCGPYRQHDLMYAIRDPFEPVVQIDVYSPMAMHRSSEHIATAIEELVDDMAKGLDSVGEEADG